MNARSLIIQCSNSCMCFCPGCYNFFSNKDTIKTERIVSFVTEYNEIFSNSKVTLSGGDPLMRPDIAELISKLKAQNCYINIDTTGLPLIKNSNEAVFEALKYVEYIGIPMDGVNNKTIHSFRQNMTFEMSLKVLKKAASINRICVNTVVHALNVDEVIEIAAIVNKEYNIFKWQLFQYMPIGPRGYAMRGTYGINNDTFENVKRKLLSLHFRASLEMEFKSVSDRVNKYILLGSDGYIWLPKLNEERTIIGHIDDIGLIEKIENIKDYEKI